MTTQTELLREAVALDEVTTEDAPSWYNSDMAIAWVVGYEAAQDAFLAKIDAAEGEESEFQVISGADEDACIEAATSGPRDVALREAMRYAHQYAEDGPVKVVELVTVAMLPAARRQESE